MYPLNEFVLLLFKNGIYEKVFKWDAYHEVKRKNKFMKYHYIYINTKLGTDRMKVHKLFLSSILIFLYHSFSFLFPISCYQIF